MVQTHTEFLGGHAHLVILEARDLLALDTKLFGKGTSDPYVKVLVADKREVFKTSVKKKTLEPVWNESCEFEVHPEEQDVVLAFRLFDHDSMSFDDPLGRAELPLRELMHSPDVDVWLQVLPDAKCKKAKGQIHVQGRFVPTVAPLQQATKMLEEAKAVVLARCVAAAEAGDFSSWAQFLKGMSRLDLSAASDFASIVCAVADGADANVARVPDLDVASEQALKILLNDVKGFAVAKLHHAFVVGDASDVSQATRDFQELYPDIGPGLADASEKQHFEMLSQIMQKEYGLDLFPYGVPEEPVPEPLTDTFFFGGEVHICIHAAKDLLAMDVKLIGKGKSDPYVKVLAGGKREVFKTEVMKKTVDPLWNASGKFQVGPEEASIVLALFDHDLGSKDDPMGQVTIRLLDFVSDGSFIFKEQWCKVEAQKACPKAKGEVHVSLAFAPTPPPMPEKEVPITLLVAMRAAAVRASAKALEQEGFQAHAETFSSLTRLDSSLTCKVGQLSVKELRSTGLERETFAGASDRTDALLEDRIAVSLAQLQDAIVRGSGGEAEEEILATLAELMADSMYELADDVDPNLATDLRSASDGNRERVVQELLQAHGYHPTDSSQPIVPFAMVVEKEEVKTPTPEPTPPPTPLTPEERRELVLMKVKDFGMLLRAVPEFSGDREVVLEALSAVQGDSQTLMYAAPELRSDPEVVRVAVQHHGCALKYAAPDLQSDRDLVLEAVRQNGLALAYADWHLRKDRDLVLAAILQDGEALQYATCELKQDVDLVATAVYDYGMAIRFAAPELQNGKLALARRKHKSAAHRSASKEAFQKMLNQPTEAERDNTREMYREMIREIYRTHDPEKMANAEGFFSKYAGKEKPLYLDICKRYNVTPQM